MHLLVTLALVGGKLDDPVPPSAKLADPPAWSARVMPASLKSADPPARVAPARLPAKPPVPKAAVVGEWRPFAANPSYEVYGHVDESGVFRYSTFRAKAFQAAPRYYAPVLQYGSPCANGACQR